MLRNSIQNTTIPLVFEDCSSDTVCVIQGEYVRTEIKMSVSSEIIQISRILYDDTGRIGDCFEMNDATQWFGGPQQRRQHWPIQRAIYDEEPYLPTHPINMGVAERYWLSGRGIYIFVADQAPLFLDQNNYKEKNLCLIAKNGAPYRQRENIELNYKIGVFPDPRSAHERAVQDHLGKPIGYPDERMITHPIWSTWARYKANVSAEVVNTFADEILAHDFDNSQLEIDDNWETCYGSAVFDQTKFPDVRSLTDDLRSRGFRVTLWIHPFINEDCLPYYTEALENGYFVKNLEGNVRTSWWQGEQAGQIDFTNLEAVAWWVERLKSLQDVYGIDSFKFDAGESSWLPQTPDLTVAPELSPAIFTSRYVETLFTNFGLIIEARVGWRTQNLPIFIRMLDKDTNWSWNNGLPTLITTLLQMNMNGYIHVLPDMIGGNGYLNGFLNGTEYPPKEMFIRWLQTNVFMPSLQYSFVPWDFDTEVKTFQSHFLCMVEAATEYSLTQIFCRQSRSAESTRTFMLK